mmetsp:Transcript_22804/g.46431  ORF Transcript_22804/g.46431 Transcript_22804/m.46431 type:complete len:98 (+) Transcript_22804:432-725(+)
MVPSAMDPASKTVPPLGWKQHHSTSLGPSRVLTKVPAVSAAEQSYTTMAPSYDPTATKWACGFMSRLSDTHDMESVWGCDSGTVLVTCVVESEDPVA